MNLNKEQLHIELCKKDLYYFMCSLWSVIVPNEFIPMPYIRPFANLAQARIEMMGTGVKKEADWIVCLPPATTKTLLMIFAQAWAWLNYPQLTILGTSHTSNKSFEHATLFRKIVTSEQYQQIRPLKLLDDANSKSHIVNEFNGSRSATSLESSVLGSHFVWICSDDLMTIDDCKVEAQRVKAFDYATAFLGSRTGNMPHSQTWFFNQRLHLNDLPNYLESVGKYEKLVLPAEETENILPAEFKQYYRDGLLDNVRLTPEYLEGKRNLLGNSAYNAQFQQAPGESADCIIKESYFDIISQETADELFNNDTNSPMHFFCDGAYTTNLKNDPSGILGCFVINGRAYITCLGEWWLAFPDLKKKLRGFCYENGYSKNSTLFVEAKGPGISLIQDLREGGINCREAPEPIKSKQDRLTDISQRLEAKKVVLVQGAWNRKFLNEVTQDGKHWEFRDILYMIVTKLLPQGGGKAAWRTIPGIDNYLGHVSDTTIARSQGIFRGY